MLILTSFFFTAIVEEQQRSNVNFGKFTFSKFIFFNNLLQSCKILTDCLYFEDCLCWNHSYWVNTIFLKKKI